MLAELPGDEAMAGALAAATPQAAALRVAAARVRRRKGADRLRTGAQVANGWQRPLGDCVR
jgi:hypothetical protein